VHRDHGLIKAVQDRDRKAWCADSQFSSAQDHQVLAAGGLRDRARHIRAGPANSVEDHTQQVLQDLADIRRVQEWAV